MIQTSRTNILLEVATLSMRIGRQYVASYSHLKSPHKFTPEQLLTCLILRAYLKTTYRGVIEFLKSLRLCSSESG
ncbi:hypothetical protein [Planctomicrobium sp. SH664]|uniref:hypothetical protein n=1 Tax=Planctomicrobium sp. SH664 TaxID=3448125 RepID=UPI003F5C44BF